MKKCNSGKKLKEQARQEHASRLRMKEPDTAATRAAVLRKIIPDAQSVGVEIERFNVPA